ncbi:MAG: replication-relaxation family protein [Acidimicrobiales bacterium]
MTGDRLSERGLRLLRMQLSTRDLAIVGQVAEFRLMSTRQLEVLYFTDSEHDSALAAARACRRVLERLVRERLLVRLERRIGGVRAGSASFVYALGPVGQRVLELDGPRKRFKEPSAHFTDHTLAVSQMVVDLTVAGREGRLELLEAIPEPGCWRRYAGAEGHVVLRPDLVVALGAAAYEYRWFVEVDLGTEHVPTLLAKCRVYDDYYRTGTEQRSQGVFPRVCWIMPTPQRVQELEHKLKASGRFLPAMFAVTTTDAALTTLIGRAP